MNILKTLRKLDELATIEAEKEKQEQERRKMLIMRLEKSRYNNLKLFNLNPKGDSFC